jgi:hypothetical protein
VTDYSSSPFYGTAINAANTYGIPTNLFIAQIGQESGFNPLAQNGNATGIAQFMPGTAQDLGVNPSDPISSLYGAAKYDSQLYSKLGSFTATMQAYGTTAGGAGPQVAAIAQQVDAGLLNNLTSQSPTGNVPASGLGSLISGTSSFLGFVTDIPRMLTLIFGVILVIAGLFMLGNKQSISIVNAVKDAAGHIPTPLP